MQQQARWTLAEKMVFEYLQQKNINVRPATLEEQYQDIDMVFTDEGKDVTLSVKYMPKAVKTRNFSFETKLISAINTEKQGWFHYGKSDVTVIVLPEEGYTAYWWVTAELKEMVNQKAFKTVRLTNFQKSTNAQRFYKDAENLLVKIDDLIKECFEIVPLRYIVNTSN